jgi:uncharacterized protein YqeY
MKARDTDAVTALRSVDSAIKKIAIDENREIDDDLVISVLRKSIKSLKGANAQFAQGGRVDLVKANEQEMALLDKYLPQQIQGAALGAIVDEAIAQSGAQSNKEMGKVMGVLKKRPDAALIDFSEVNPLIQSKLG